jgi:peroxiredoxin
VTWLKQTRDLQEGAEVQRVVWPKRPKFRSNDGPKTGQSFTILQPIDRGSHHPAALEYFWKQRITMWRVNASFDLKELQMKSWFAAFLVGALLAASSVYGQEFRVGSQVADFSLTQPDGSPAKFSALKGNVTLVMFISVQCPVSNAYDDRMNSLYQDYAAKGVKFIVINANRTEPAAAVQEHARQHSFQFPVYKDENNVVADRFGASVTPETYVIDSTGVIRYHGSIDDSQNVSRVTTRRLALALDAVLAGKEPPQAETKAFGCSIKRAPKST